MDEDEFKQVTQRLLDVDAVIKEVDPSLRDGAWEILRKYVAQEDPKDGSSTATQDKKRKRASGTGQRTKPKREGSEKVSLPPSDATEDVLVEKFESLEDADNLSLAIAVVYKRYGRGPFKLSLIKSVASSLGLEIPKRPDMTLKSRKGNLRKQEDGWKIMPGGEKWLQETYGVERGKQTAPDTV
jgi:hypothetical protein